MAEQTKTSPMPEPWLRATLLDVPVVHRGALHALELAREDMQRWCVGLDDSELNARPCALPSIAFQVRHIARSLDRFCTYAEGRPLSEAQMHALKGEMKERGTRDALFAEFTDAVVRAEQRLRALIPVPLETPLHIGRKALPTTLGGLLVHVADHTQRHVGQAITTAKVVVAKRSSDASNQPAAMRS